MFWRKRKNKITEFRFVQLPGDVGRVSVPADFVVEMEDDSTLMACPRGEETITLRFSSISAVLKEPGEDGGRSFVKRSAAREGRSYSELPGGKGVESYREESERDGVSRLDHFWIVGCRNTVVIISAAVPESRLHDGVVKATLAAMPVILESLEVTKVHGIVESGDKEVFFTVQTTDPTPQSVRSFDMAEEQWLETGLNQARALGLRYGTGGELTPEELDRVFSRWMAEHEGKESGDLVASALGAAFGAFFVEQHRFRWMVVTDEYGTDYAVQHALGQTMAFPCSSVRKRIERGEPEFFQDIYLMILDQLERATEEAQGPH
ncbi:MAG: DUF3806 domain-containing protein [Verrucomicrobia bacterium]|nr:DUF3806 domain-containing protein [Verrucomicrobiota bacterium]